jgi:hypothetical protein
MTKEKTMGHHDHHTEHGDTHSESAVSFDEKAGKLIAHWIHHNNEHAKSYERWIGEFRHHGLEEAARLLESVGSLTDQMTQILEQIADQLPSGD